MRQLRIISFTAEGMRMGQNLSELLSEDGIDGQCFAPERYIKHQRLHKLPQDIREWIGSSWGEMDYLFIGATGIAVRFIAPWVKDKYIDPAVLCMDEKGAYVIPLLSGHVGGAVELSKRIAKASQGIAVITTATDVNEQFAVDVFARKNHLEIKNRELAKRISAFILDGGTVGLYSEYPIIGECPRQLKRCRQETELLSYELSVAVTDKIDQLPKSQILYLLPKNLAVGIGCRRGTKKERIRIGLSKVLEISGNDESQIACIASVDLKKDEEGLNLVAKELQVPYLTYPADELIRVGQVSCASEFVRQVTGVDNVCERAALLAGGKGELIVNKTIVDGITFAVVKKELEMEF